MMSDHEMGAEPSFNMTFELKDKYLYCEIFEDINVNNYILIFQNILKYANSNNKNRILIDGRKIHVFANVLNRFDIGEFMANYVKFACKIAALTSEKEFKKRFAETVARNRGLNFLVFLEEQQAIKWLLK